MKRQQLDESSRAARFDLDPRYHFFPEMRAGFREKANAILSGELVITGDSNRRRIGVELEFSCVYRNGQTLAELDRDLVLDHGAFYQPELGANQIEIMTSPIDVSINRFSSLKGAICETTGLLVERLGLVRGNLIRHGTDPVLVISDDCRTTSYPRYRIVPDFHDHNRNVNAISLIGRGDEKVNVGRAIVVAATSSIQPNIDCHSSEEAIDLLNRALMASPLAVALGANARFVDGVDTGYADVRGMLWDYSHDVRNSEEVQSGIT